MFYVNKLQFSCDLGLKGVLILNCYFTVFNLMIGQILKLQYVYIFFFFFKSINDYEFENIWYISFVLM